MDDNYGTYLCKQVLLSKSMSIGKRYSNAVVATKLKTKKPQNWVMNKFMIMHLYTVGSIFIVTNSCTSCTWYVYSFVPA